MSNKTVYIIIGCDTDPDRDSFLDDLPKETLSWRGMVEGIPAAKENLKDIFDSDGNNPVFSWCLRVDEQIKNIHGSYDYILKTHKEFFLELENNGDELSWHPHFFKFDDTEEKWYQEFMDQAWQVEMLKNSYASYQNIFPGRAKSVRMGWDYHNNSTFSTLQELGVKVDFSGLPGMCMKPKNNKIRSVNFYDWSLAPNHPYFPVANDYRQESSPSETAFSLLEAPNFVSKSMLWSLISGLVMTKKMKNINPLIQAVKNPSYWITITGTTKYFNPLMNQLSKEIKQKDKIFFVTYFHPDELIENKNPLYSFENLKQNIQLLLKTSADNNASVKFIKASEIKKYI